MKFLGHDIDYWVELERVAKKEGYDEILTQLVETRHELYVERGKLEEIKRLLK